LLQAHRKIITTLQKLQNYNPKRGAQAVEDILNLAAQQSLQRCAGDFRALM
jgi:hypothetical protein